MLLVPFWAHTATSKPRLTGLLASSAWAGPPTPLPSATSQLIVSCTVFPHYCWTLPGCPWHPHPPPWMPCTSWSHHQLQQPASAGRQLPEVHSSGPCQGQHWHLSHRGEGRASRPVPLQAALITPQMVSVLTPPQHKLCADQGVAGHSQQQPPAGDPLRRPGSGLYPALPSSRRATRGPHRRRTSRERRARLNEWKPRLSARTHTHTPRVSRSRHFLQNRSPDAPCADLASRRRPHLAARDLRPALTSPTAAPPHPPSALSRPRTPLTQPGRPRRQACRVHPSPPLATCPPGSRSHAPQCTLSQ